MAHVAKYNQSAVGHMLKHYSRESNATNESIDPTRTPLNYNLAPPHPNQTDYEFLQERLKQVKVQKRKDVNLMCDWIVTAPKDLPKEEHAAFFKAAYEFLEGKYGKANTISAWVHADEVTPHLHYCFCPIVKSINKKTQQPIEKVSAKELLTREELQRFHPELQTHIERALGHHVSILNDATKEGNRAIQELKRESALERLENAERQASAIINQAEAQVAPKKAEYEAYKTYIDENKKLIKPLDPKKIKTKGIVNKTQVIEVSREEWEARDMRFHELEAISRARLALDNSINKIKQLDLSVELDNMKYLYEHQSRELRAKDDYIHQLELQAKRALAEKEAFFSKIPQEYRQTFIDLWNEPQKRRQEQEHGHHRFR